MRFLTKERRFMRKPQLEFIIDSKDGYILKHLPSRTQIAIDLKKITKREKYWLSLWLLKMLEGILK